MGTWGPSEQNGQRHSVVAPRDRATPTGQTHLGISTPASQQADLNYRQRGWSLSVPSCPWSGSGESMRPWSWVSRERHVLGHPAPQLSPRPQEPSPGNPGGPAGPGSTNACKAGAKLATEEDAVEPRPPLSQGSLNQKSQHPLGGHTGGTPQPPPKTGFREGEGRTWSLSSEALAGT